MKNRELYLVDGYSVIYRGYFAFLNRPLLNPQGRNSSSVFVFFRTLFQVLRTRAPETLAVAMDSRVPTFRHVRYEAYKATRDKAPQDLHAQVPVIEEILHALKIPCIRADGYEADDVIATLAESCRRTGTPCWILSGDKDILQLIGGNVRLLAQEKGTTDLVEYSREKVYESRGVYPDQIVDFLSLTGDSSDNVPGVPGIKRKLRFGMLTSYSERMIPVRMRAARMINTIRIIGLKSTGPVMGTIRRMGASSGSTIRSSIPRTGLYGGATQDSTAQMNTTAVKTLAVTEMTCARMTKLIRNPRSAVGRGSPGQYEPAWLLLQPPLRNRHLCLSRAHSNRSPRACAP